MDCSCIRTRRWLSLRSTVSAAEGEGTGELWGWGKEVNHRNHK